MITCYSNSKGLKTGTHVQQPVGQWLCRWQRCGWSQVAGSRESLVAFVLLQKEGGDQMMPEALWTGREHPIGTVVWSGKAAPVKFQIASSAHC